MARTLDVVGDRWTLLIVREMLLRPELRFRELAAGLPGVASNLLADRLRSLQADDVIEAVGEDGTGGYRLTPRGRALGPVIRELTTWGLPLMMDRSDDGDAWRGRWAALAIDALLADADTSACPPFHAAISTDDDEVHVIVEPGRPVEVSAPTRDDDLPAIVTVRIRGPVAELQRFLGGDPSGVLIDGDPGPLMALLASTTAT